VFLIIILASYITKRACCTNGEHYSTRVGEQQDFPLTLRLVQAINPIGTYTYVSRATHCFRGGQLGRQRKSMTLDYSKRKREMKETSTNLSNVYDITFSEGEVGLGKASMVDHADHIRESQTGKDETLV